LRTSADDAVLLNYADFLETHYINKPIKKIIRVLASIYLNFFYCFFFSFNILIVPMIPLWVYSVYRFYTALKYFKKFNLSPSKIIFFTLVICIIEMFLCSYIRKILYLIFIF